MALDRLTALQILVPLLALPSRPRSSWLPPLPRLLFSLKISSHPCHWNSWFKRISTVDLSVVILNIDTDIELIDLGKENERETKEKE